MSAARPGWRWRDRLERWESRINAAAFVLLAVLAVVAIDAARTNRAQDEALTQARAEQIEQNSKVLECVDRYTTELSEGQPEVRRATKRYNDALGRYASALLSVVIARSVDNLGTAAIGDAASALQSFQAAAAALDRAILANPVPPPPSVACRYVSPTAGD